MPTKKKAESGSTINVQRLPAEQLFQKEIDALIAAEKNPVPTGWRMSPKSVLTYITGGKAGRTVITPKYIGHRRLVEIAIATLVTDRALLLVGEPGTAKSWRRLSMGILRRLSKGRRALQRSRSAIPGTMPC